MRLRNICEGLPEAEATPRPAGQHCAFAVRGKKFAWYLDDHHGDGRIALQCKAPPGEMERLVAVHPGRYYRPPYMARHGWVGLYLDTGEIDWDEVAGLVTVAYLLTAPRKLAEQVGG